MGYLGRRIGKSQSTATDPGNGTGGGLLDLFTSGYFQRQGNIYNAPGEPPPQGLTATGGVISDYVDGSTVYRAHIFTSSGTFDVTALANNPNVPNNVEYLVVAGGGGAASGGGGAGGYRTNVPTSIAPPAHNTTSPFPVSIATYPVTIGAGGNGVPNPSPGATVGGDSSFGPPSNPQRIISSGGGFSGSINVNNANPGGSGGGSGRASTHESPGGTTIAITGLPVSPTTQGNPGGRNESDANYNGGGGGGAGAPGGNASPGNSSTGIGGDGLRNAIAGPNYPIGTPGPGPTTGGWFAGGGGTGGDGGVSPAAPGGAGGGGAGAGNGTPGTANTGGGAGGGGEGKGGNGGSGIVIVRYQIGTVQTGTEKATGGAISYYNSGSGMKTIHTFTNTGTFTAPASFNETVEYFIIGGGGGGGADRAGGGGAGALVTGSTPFAGPVALTVNVGGGGIGGIAGPPNGGTAGANGSSSSVNFPAGTQTAPGGGGGGGSDTDGGNGSGNPGASGGGTSRCNPIPGQSPEPTRGLATHPSGNPGGLGYNGSDPYDGGGGGGGTGGAGGNAPSGGVGGAGGEGTQAPPTFRNPKSSVGFPGPGGNYYFAGGGGGGAWGPGPGPGGVGKAGGGAGGAGPDTPGKPGIPASTNSGSGGGGGGGYPGAPTSYGGFGGSGIVLIAYPS